MTARAKIFARLSGAAAGLALAGGLIISGLLPASEAGLGGARLAVLANPTGELAVVPSGRFLSTAGLEPGPASAGVRAATTVTNQTATVLGVRVRAIGAAGALGDLVRFELTAGGQALARGPLQRLRDWSAESFRLHPGESEQLGLRAWLPASTKHGYEARSARMTLQFDTRFVGE
jgi:hypothetical protein